MRLSEIIKRRNEIAKQYDERLERLSGIRQLKVPPNITSTYYKYVAFLDTEIDRDLFKHRLRDRGVSCAREVNRVILASTTWVYDQTVGVADEDTVIPMPDHIYTKTKIGQEHLVYTWNRHFGLPYTILRYDIPYGPRMRENMAISIFVRRAMRGEPITIFGDGEQGRCFIYVEDLAEGSVAALREEAKNQIFNIAGAEFVTINRIVENLKEVFNQIKVVCEPSRPGDFRGVKICIRKAEKTLRWIPKMSFSVGLRKYVEHMKGKDCSLDPK